MRLRSEIWVQAYLRRVQVAGASAYVMRRGDGDAGAIVIVVASRDGPALYVPALAPEAAWGERRWSARIGAAADSRDPIDRFIDREAAIDPDLWVIEVEDREGRHFLGDELMEG